MIDTQNDNAKLTELLVAIKGLLIMKNLTDTFWVRRVDDRIVVGFKIPKIPKLDERGGNR
jgi:hypothetical protein